MIPTLVGLPEARIVVVGSSKRQQLICSNSSICDHQSRMKAVLALALGCLAISATIAEEITVKTNKGAVKGVRIDHDFGQYYYSFRGIRYAQAPVGKLRFKVIFQIRLENQTFVKMGLEAARLCIAQCRAVPCRAITLSKQEQSSNKVDMIIAAS